MSEESPADPGDPGASAEAAQLTPEMWHQLRRLAWLYLAAAICLLPWIAYLALSLPRRSLDVHYRAAWVGFDLLLGFTLARTAYMAFKVDARVQLSATAAATLLIVDAWFDVTTSHGRAAVGEALLLAVAAELPIALFCLYVARRISQQVLELAHLERVRSAKPLSDRGRFHHDLPDDPPT